DGTDLYAQMIDGLITQQNGRFFACAAGNAGNIDFHLGYDSQPDSSFTWMTYYSALHDVFYEWWIDSSDAHTFEFAFGADDPATWNSKGRTKYWNLIDNFNYSGGFSTKKDTLWFNATRIGIVTMKAAKYNGSYYCDVTIKPDFTSYYWRFI